MYNFYLENVKMRNNKLQKWEQQIFKVDINFINVQKCTCQKCELLKWKMQACENECAIEVWTWFTFEIGRGPEKAA